MQNSRLEPRSSFWGGLSRIIEGPVAWILTLIVIPILLVAVLLLPPVNLLDRLEAFTYTRITSAGGAVTDPDGTTVSFPAESVNSSVLASLSSVPRADFVEGSAGRDLFDAAAALPDFLVAKSPYYELDLKGTQPSQAIITIPIPNDSLPYETLDLYTWTGSEWLHVPNSVLAANDLVESDVTNVPANFMVMQTISGLPMVTANLGLSAELPQGAVVTYDAKAGLQLRGDGALEGVAPVNNGSTLPIVRNWYDDVVRTDLINNLLIDPGQQDNQLNAVEQTIVVNGYPGVVVDYRGVDAVPSARADYVRLITALAERLHAAGKTIGVRVEAPRQISAEEWDTLGYDWPALAAVVDTLIVPAPVDPRAYEPNGEMHALINFATNQIDRRKLQIELPAQSVERAGNYLLMKGYQESLQPLLAEIKTESSDGAPQVGLTLDNERMLQRVAWNEATGAYTYSYIDDQGFERLVSIENAGSIAHKLQMLKGYNVRDASIAVHPAGDVDPNIWNVLLQFQNGGDLSAAAGRMSVAYNIYDAANNLVAQDVRPLENPAMAFLPGEANGDLRIEAQILGASGQPVTAPQSTVLAMGGEQAAPAAAAAPASDVEGVVGTTDAAPTVSSGQIVNVRGGPGTAYPVLGQINPGSDFKVTGKSEAGDWWEIDFSGQPGWIIDQLVDVSGTVDGVAVVTDIPEPPAPVEAAAAAPAPAGDAPAPAAAPVVAAPPPSGAVPFGYGIQAHMVHTGDAMIQQVMNSTKGMGFNWIKQQIEWRVMEGSAGNIDWGSMDPIVNAANGAGINLLFSVVNAPAWARESGFDGSVGGPPADPQTYANFVGALAGKYCGSSVKMIEVWNEQNLHYEWGNKPLNPAEYVQLLAPAYGAIKAACPSMVVVSGALTPAGNNPPYAMDDFTYLEAMMQAGAANYMDALGSHPSGYNVPPSVTWEGACEAIQKTGNSFNGACDSPHHSWSFRSTMEGYRNIMNVYGAGDRVIVPTEFGWAAGGAFDPRYKYADDNDFDEQARWTVEAYQMMKNWGWVGPAFLWNLNFRVVANGTEKAQWGIVDPGWGPLPAYNALASMPK